MALTTAAVADIWQRVIEGTLTAEQLQRILLAAVAGKSTNDGTKFRNVADTKNRIDGTVTGKDRTAVTLDGT